MVIESLLSPLGYTLTTAMDGDEALELMRSRDFLPDLVLLDVQMFEKTGFEVTDTTVSGSEGLETLIFT